MTLRQLIRQELLKEAYDINSEEDSNTGAKTCAGADIIMYMVTTEFCLKYARTKGKDVKSMKDVFDFVVQNYIRETKTSPFENGADCEDGSDDRETVMYDFFANYPTHYIFEKD